MGQLLVAHVHLAQHPLQGADHPLRLDHHRRQQVRDAVVAGQLHALGVHHQQAQVIGSVVQQQAGDDGVDAHRFARAGSPGDEHVRHRRKVGCRGAAGHILAQRKTQRRFQAAESLALDHIAQRHQRNLFVGHFDAHVALAGHRGLDADGARRERQRQVVGQGGNLAHAHARAARTRLYKIRLDAELGDGWAAVDLDHVDRRAEGAERFFNHAGALAVNLVIVDNLIARIQDIFQARQGPGARLPRGGQPRARDAGFGSRGGARGDGRLRPRQRLELAHCAAAAQAIQPIIQPVLPACQQRAGPAKQLGHRAIHCQRQADHQPGQQRNRRAAPAQAAAQHLDQRGAQVAAALPQAGQIKGSLAVFGEDEEVQGGDQQREQQDQAHHALDRNQGDALEAPQDQP